MPHRERRRRRRSRGGGGGVGGGGSNNASVTLNLARAAGIQASRARAAYPPTDQVLAQLSFTVNFSGGPAADKTITANPGTATVQVSIAAGTWRIKTQAYLNGVLYAEGDETLNLKPGNNGTTVLMLRNAGMVGVVYKYHDGRPDTSEAVLQSTAATGPGAVTTGMATLAEGLYSAPIQSQPDTFVGWYTDQTYGTAWNFNNLVTHDIVLHAKWNRANTAIDVSGATGTTIVEKTLDYVNGANGDYVLFLESDISGVAGVSGISNYNNPSYKLTLRADADTPRTISLGGSGAMFWLGTGKLEIENINLRGSTSNSYSLVNVISGTEFILNSGTISGNTNSGMSSGGGVGVSGGTFTMNGGTISGNTASYGGGVYVYSGTFTKTGGTIYGSDAADPLNANTATAGSGSGHAVTTPTKYRDTTAGPGDNIDSGSGAGLLP